MQPDLIEVPVGTPPNVIEVYITPTPVVEVFREQGAPGPPGQWVQMTQAQYNALSPKDANTLYVIVG